MAEMSRGTMQPVAPDFGASIPEGCLLDVLDLVPTHAGPGAARATMGVATKHLNQRGVLQGGALIALADAVAAWATYPAVQEGQRVTTLELKANLLGAAREGDELVAVASPVHLGRSTIVLDVDVMKTDQEEKPELERRLVSRFTCTQMVLPAA